MTHDEAIATADGVVASLREAAEENDAVGWRENAMLFYAEMRGAQRVRDALSAGPSDTESEDG